MTTRINTNPNNYTAYTTPNAASPTVSEDAQKVVQIQQATKDYEAFVATNGPAPSSSLPDYLKNALQQAGLTSTASDDLNKALISAEKQFWIDKLKEVTSLSDLAQDITALGVLASGNLTDALNPDNGIYTQMPSGTLTDWNKPPLPGNMERILFAADPIASDWHVTQTDQGIWTATSKKGESFAFNGFGNEIGQLPTATPPSTTPPVAAPSSASPECGTPPGGTPPGTTLPPSATQPSPSPECGTPPGGTPPGTTLPPSATHPSPSPECGTPPGGTPPGTTLPPSATHPSASPECATPSSGAGPGSSPQSSGNIPTGQLTSWSGLPRDMRRHMKREDPVATDWTIIKNANGYTAVSNGANGRGVEALTFTNDGKWIGPAVTPPPGGTPSATHTHPKVPGMTGHLPALAHLIAELMSPRSSPSSR